MQHVLQAYPSHLVPILETVLFLVGILVLVLWPNGSSRLADKLLAKLAVPAKSAGRVILTVGLVAGLGNAITTLIQGPPIPVVSDEWSYLLATETFASGRITNPPSPHRSLVGENTLGTPTYQSKYPPAQGSILALGQRLGGHPVVGLWLSAALLAAAVTWCLQAWVGPQWAFLGGLLIALRLGIGSYWNQSYWGGSIAAIGGALVYGAVRRLTVVDKPRLRDALLLGLGLLVLANSRPFEGMLVSLPAAWMLVRWFFGLPAAQKRVAVAKVVLPICGILVVTVMGVGYYNWRVTGDPLKMPHLHYKEIYERPSEFVWARHPGTMSQHVAVERNEAGEETAWWRLGLRNGWHRIWLVLFLVLSPALAVPLLFGLWALRDRTLVPLLVACVMVLLGHFASDQFYPHYSAPLTAPIWTLAMVVLIKAHDWRWRQQPVGAGLGLVALGLILVSFLVQIPAFRPDADAPIRRRLDYQQELAERPGRHLVLGQRNVIYNYNPADIRGADVLWAADMGTDENRRLIELFPDYEVWWLEIYGRSVELQTYESR
jgi:hypothetical protein